MRLHGRVTDFEGRPLHEAEIQVNGRGFAGVAYTTADANGQYVLTLERGTYLCVWICKGYKNTRLEYWAWHLPAEEDLELNARVDRLEVYGLNVFWPRYRPTLMVYFRPMSLKRALAWEAGAHDEADPVAMAPDLRPEDVEVDIDGEPAPLLCLNKVREMTRPPHSYMDAYLAHVQADGIWDRDTYRKIDVAIVDRETQERGEGSVFWRPPRYEEGSEAAGEATGS